VSDGRKSRSFRWRLAIFSALVSGVILIAFGVAAWYFSYKKLLDSVDSRLVEPAERSVRRSHADRDWDRLREMMKQFSGEVRQETRQIVMANATGELLYISEPEEGAIWISDVKPLKAYLPTPEELASAPPNPVREERPRRGSEGEGNREGAESDREPPRGEGSGPGRPGRPRFPGDPRGGWKTIGEPEFFTMMAEDGSRWRMIAMSNSSVTVFAGMDLAEFDAEARQVRTYFLLALPLGLLAIAAGAWAISRRAMRPLDRIINTASSMDAADLSKRIPVTGTESQEFSQLVTVLNAMMDRLEGSFHQANRFTADASHELKTPIAIMQAEIESALKSCPPDSPEEASLVNLQEENQRLNRITQSLLLLSQADSGKLKLAQETVDLSEELEALAEDAGYLCAKDGLEFSSDIAPGINVKADRVLLMQAVLNLLSNAIKYNCEKGSVACRLVADGSEAVIEFFNTGEPIPEDEQGKIFDRFYRVDKVRGPAAEGFGLGLNLSLEIVRAHGGTLKLTQSDSSGTRMELRLARA